MIRREKFSKRERDILEILGRRKMTIREITEALFNERLPLDANNSVAMSIRRINSKCEFYDLPWRLESKGGGRAGKTIWRESK